MPSRVLRVNTKAKLSSEDNFALVFTLSTLLGTCCSQPPQNLQPQASPHASALLQHLQHCGGAINAAVLHRHRSAVIVPHFDVQQQQCR